MTIELNNPSLLQTQAFINGQWVDANSGETFPVFNPANGEEIAQVANCVQEETAAAIAVAKKAMESWKEQPAKVRSELLEKWYDLVMANQEDLAKIMTMEQGKVLAESRGEVAYGASYIKWFSEEAKRIYGDVIQGTPDRRGIVIKQPVGVVGAITPWNFPNAMITRKVAPALAAGCSIVLKPGSETPLSALALAELAKQAGIPDGVFNVVAGRRSSLIGGELTSNPDVAKVTFTGSTPVGKTLMKQCAETVKRTSMELGGNAPVIIFDDADLDIAINGSLLSKFRNSGQTCICTNRVLVQEGIYDEFVKRFSAAVNEFNFGDGLDDASTHGPVVSANAVSDIDDIVKRSVEKGATVVTGGKPREGAGFFYEPTILTNVDDTMSVFREEIFGPVAPIFKFKTEEEAINMANDTEFGLAAYFYSDNLSRVWRVAEKIDYGMVGVNETMISSELIPFGGVKESGQGREGSKYGLDDYLEIKYVCMGGMARNHGA